MKLLVLSSVFAALPFAAHAADFYVPQERSEQAFEEKSPVKGKLSLWGQYVMPSGLYDSADDTAGSDYCGYSEGEFCENAWGFGGYAALQAPIGGAFSILGDLTIDYHNETDGDDENNDESPLYGAVGLHIIGSSNGSDYGVFGLVGSATTLEDDDIAGPFGGGGVEFRYHNFFVQGGALFGLVEDEDSVVDNLYFVRAGGEFDVGPGVLSANGAYGWGDFDGSDGGADDDDDAQWVQLMAQYEAPLTQHINWFIGYQGDWVEVAECCGSNTERGWFHTGKIGLTIPVGGGDTPFSTPNFRAPIVTADGFN